MDHKGAAMTSTKESPQVPPAVSPVPFVLVRVLALVDALLVPGLLLYWISTWPDHHGGFVGAVVAAGLVWWAVKRGQRAVFELDSYRWTMGAIVKLYVIWGVVYAVWHISQWF